MFVRLRSPLRTVVIGLVVGIVSATGWSLVGPATATPVVDTSVPIQDAGVGGDAKLARALRSAVLSAGFRDVVDFGAEEGRCPGGTGCPSTASRIGHLPDLDLAVIELGSDGRVSRAADVVLSRDHPRGAVVPLGQDLSAEKVAWHRWDQDRADGQKDWNAPRTAADGLRGTDGGADLQFMSPYPGPLFQLLVAVGTLHLADAGRIDLDADYRYAQDVGSTCLGDVFSETASSRELLGRTIRRSDTRSTCMLIKQLADLGELENLNTWFAGLGLSTLHLGGFDEGSGGRWDPSGITMTAMDTARLLLLVEGASVGPAWTTPTGRQVTSDHALSWNSRTLLRQLLAEQGFNEVLSTTNWCGREHPGGGIPQRVDDRWIDAKTGVVTVQGVPYGQDVRPCNESAEVTFAHKTGLTYNFASDAGIVRSLPGHPERHYIVVVTSDLGYRFADLRFADSDVLPCTIDQCYTEAFARLGATVDDVLAADKIPASLPSASGSPEPSARTEMPTSSPQSDGRFPRQSLPAASPRPMLPGVPW
jgi:hypothetical protein